MLLVTVWFGTFLLDGETVAKHALFPKEPEAIASRLRKIDNWQVLDEERALLRAAPEVFVTEPRLERAGGRMLQERPPFLSAEDYGFDRKLLHEAMLLQAKAQMRLAPQPDDHLAQAIRGLDDLNESSNLLLVRLREWYGLHYPELSRMVDDAEYLRLIEAYGQRDAMPDAMPESIGGELGPREQAAVQAMATSLRSLAAERRALLEYVEQASREVAPTLTRLVGPRLTAHLIARAGGLRKLARMPSSTIQTLGAEKAFFRHLRDGTPPPKHGLLFMHPLIHTAPPWQRGSIARAMAGKITMAARADFYTKREIGEELAVSLDQAVKSVRSRRSSPPKRSKARRRRRH